jgi:hypothetical protein
MPFPLGCNGTYRRPHTRDELTGRMPIVAHESVAGVDCCGCIIAAVEGSSVEPRCNECGAVVGVIQIDILCGCWGWTCEGCGADDGAHEPPSRDYSVTCCTAVVSTLPSS